MYCCVLGATGQGHTADCDRVAPAGSCPNHKVVAHDQAGLERWCDFCGYDANGVKVRRGAGGWGTPR
jgi:hypothetical protein